MKTKTMEAVLDLLVSMLKQKSSKVEISLDGNFVVIRGEYDEDLCEVVVMSIYEVLRIEKIDLADENDFTLDNSMRIIRLSEISNETYEIWIDTQIKTKCTQSFNLPVEKVCEYLRYLCATFIAGSVEKKIQLYRDYFLSPHALNENETMYFRNGLPLGIGTLEALNYNPVVLAMYETEPKCVSLAQLLPSEIKRARNKRSTLESLILHGQAINFSRPLYPHQILCLVRSKDLVERYK